MLQIIQPVRRLSGACRNTFASHRISVAVATTVIALLLWCCSLLVKTWSWPFIALELLMLIFMGAAGKIMEPVYEHLAPVWRRAIGNTPLVLYTTLLVLFALLAGLDADTHDKGAAASALFCVCILQVMLGSSIEPDDFALERLRFRMTRAAFARVSSICCFTLGFIWLLQDSARAQSTEGIPSIAVILGLVTSAIIASLKVLARVRKQATQLDARAQDLIRSIEEFAAARDENSTIDRRHTARRSWDALDQTLRSKIDTGFHAHGTFVLPCKAITELAGKIESAIASPEAVDDRTAALSDLGALRKACSRRIDTLI